MTNSCDFITFLFVICNSFDKIVYKNQLGEESDRCLILCSAYASSIFYLTTTLLNIVHFVLKQHVLMTIEIFLTLFKIYYKLNVLVKIRLLIDTQRYLQKIEMFCHVKEKVLLVFFVVVVFQLLYLVLDFYPYLSCGS